MQDAPANANSNGPTPLGGSATAWQVVLFPALAGAMGWGIRGQYGHETGAMIAGLLVSLVLVMLLCPGVGSLQATGAVALCAAGIGFGGAMTYGQTIGLTQNPEVIGRWGALGWGMLGLGIKGALWIGFAGAFLGMGLSGVRYSSSEMARILGGMLLLMVLGVWALNMPFDPANRSLPAIYFSADWSWYPAAGLELKPRREFWGGFLFALVGLVVYLGWFRKDRLARNMALWGCLGGLGFPIGQSFQAWHAWNREILQSGFLSEFDEIINWWNFMETTFGFVMGAALGFGLWLNRRRITTTVAQDASMKPVAEFALLALHLFLLFFWEFADVALLDAVGDLGIPRSLIPLIGIIGGRFWPWLMALPVIAFPILGKTGAAMGFSPSSSVVGAVLFIGLPCAVLSWMAIRFSNDALFRSGLPTRQQLCTTSGVLPGGGKAGLAFLSEPSARNGVRALPGSSTCLCPMLLTVTWLYFVSNLAMFKFPWPWQTWTARTPSAIIFAACALAMTWAALKHGQVHWRINKSPDVAPVGHRE